jgi:6-phosphofructokinase 1
MSCAVIGVRGARLDLWPMVEIEATDTDWKHRRPTNEFWKAVSGLGDVLAGRPRDSQTIDIKICPV